MFQHQQHSRSNRKTSSNGKIRRIPENAFPVLFPDVREGFDMRNPMRSGFANCKTLVDKYRIANQFPVERHNFGVPVERKDPQYVQQAAGIRLREYLEKLILLPTHSVR